MILDIQNLHLSFLSKGQKIPVLRGVSLTLNKGEKLGIVGESGSGKSSLVKAILKLHPKESSLIEQGKIFYKDADITDFSEKEMRNIRGKEIGMVFQDPMSSLNPLMKIGRQIAKNKQRALELLKAVRIPDPETRLNAYPHTLSGGLRQRVMIAIALEASPSLLICDECTTALDVTIQAQILNLIEELQEDKSTIFITHDLSLALSFCDRIVVMYRGEIVEEASVQDLFSNPKHSYTKHLLNSLPKLDEVSCSNKLKNARLGCAKASRIASCERVHIAVNIDPLARDDSRELSREPKRAFFNLFEHRLPFITIKNLSKKFTYKKKTLEALSDINLTITQGETLGVVGESGSGKSTLGKLLLRLQNPTSGKIYFDNQEIFSLPPHELKAWRKNAQMIFQDPYTSLNPRMRAEEIVSEPFYIHNIPVTEEVIDRLFVQVGLDASFRKRFPHELSSGQRQRLSIGRAIALKPHFIVCDEPLSALDVSIQAQIVQLLKELQQKLGLTYLFITHDLRMVKIISHRIAVFYMGHIVELASSEELYKKPLHPYTEALLSAIPRLRGGDFFRFDKVLKEEPPSPLNPPKGCSFSTRCPKAQPLCSVIAPTLQEHLPGHFASCHFPSGGSP